MAKLPHKPFEVAKKVTRSRNLPAVFVEKSRAIPETTDVNPGRFVENSHSNKGVYSSGKSRTEPKITDEDLDVHAERIAPAVDSWARHVLTRFGWNNLKNISALIGNPDMVPNIIKGRIELDETGKRVPIGTINPGLVRLWRLDDAVQVEAKKRGVRVRSLIEALLNYNTFSDMAEASDLGQGATAVAHVPVRGTKLYAQVRMAIPCPMSDLEAVLIDDDEPLVYLKGVEMPRTFGPFGFEMLVESAGTQYLVDEMGFVDGGMPGYLCKGVAVPLTAPITVIGRVVSREV